MAGDEYDRPDEDRESAKGEQSFLFQANEHSGTLLAGLKHLRDQEKLFDVILKAGSETFPAHRVVLASCSDYFRAMFTDGLLECHQEEITLNGVTAKGMRHLIDYAYTSKLAIDTDNVLDVLSAASHVQILPVIGACSGFLQHQLTVDNCVDVATLSDTYSLRELQVHAYKFMCNEFSRFSMSPSFQRLSANQMRTLLQSNYPVDCPEWEVCSMLLNWIEYRIEDRLSHANRLLHCVLFQDFKVSELQQIVQLDIMKEVLAWNPQLRTYIFSKLGSRKLSPLSTRQNLMNRRGYTETVIVAGGFTVEKKGMTNDIMYMNRDCRSWEVLTTIPHMEQCNFGVTVLNNCLYIIGGCFDQNMQEVVHDYGFKFDPQKNTWTSLEPMLQERCRFYLGAVEGHLYAIGGDPSFSEDILADESRCERYDPLTNAWSTITPLSGCRSQHAGATYYHNLFISGGLQELDDIVLDDMNCYDTRIGTWCRKAPMLTPRTDHTMFVHDDRIYVAGGWFEDMATHERVLVRTIDAYNIATDQWEIVTHLPQARLHATFTCFDDKLFVIGGSIDGDHERKTKKIDILDLEVGTWESGTEFCHEVWEHAACSMYIPTNLSRQPKTIP